MDQVFVGQPSSVATRGVILPVGLAYRTCADKFFIGGHSLSRVSLLSVTHSALINTHFVSYVLYCVLSLILMMDYLDSHVDFNATNQLSFMALVLTFGGISILVPYVVVGFGRMAWRLSGRGTGGTGQRNP